MTCDFPSVLILTANHKYLKEKMEHQQEKHVRLF